MNDLRRFEDYKQDVILAYEKKKKERTFPVYLRDHSPANLKNECLDVFYKRYTDRDHETFKALYGSRDNALEYYQKIKSEGNDKFKPLDNFLKGVTRDTNKRNIELLAWLIDYQPRPHQYVDMVELLRNEHSSINIKIEATPKDNENSKSEDDSLELEETENTIHEASDENRNSDAEEIPLSVTDDLSIVNQNFGVPRKFNRTIIAFFAALVIICCTYIFYNASDHQCMYWDVDHFKAIPCDQKVDGATIIALDTFRLVRLKKITNLKLITPNGIGKIHYSKLYGKVEFYTTGGENPMDNRKRLLPMTEFIYRKYVLKLD